jgi:O-antigen ligase
MLTIFAFVIMQLALDAWRDDRRGLAVVFSILALAAIANIFYIATSRTSLVVIPVLTVVFGLRLFGWKGAAALVVGCILLAAAAWPSATFMRLRVTSFFDEMHAYASGAGPTSAGQRLEFWKQSAGFIRAAPAIGHGTGTITEQFRRADEGRSALGPSANPHNQIFAVGIQLGLVGIAVLLAMWIAHLTLFRGGSVAASVGLIVLIQNVVSSLFNSHLFDFTQGWAYVIGVGVAGGVMLKQSVAPSGSDARSPRPGHSG